MSFPTNQSGLLHEVVFIVWGQRSGTLTLLGLHKIASSVIPEIEVYRGKRNNQRAEDIPKVSCEERSAERASRQLDWAQREEMQCGTDFRMYSAVVNYTMKRILRRMKEGGVRITHLCMEHNPERNEKHVRHNCIY
jgi:hypothetical protein